MTNGDEGEAGGGMKQKRRIWPRIRGILPWIGDKVTEQQRKKVEEQQRAAAEPARTPEPTRKPSATATETTAVGDSRTPQLALESNEVLGKAGAPKAPEGVASKPKPLAELVPMRGVSNADTATEMAGYFKDVATALRVKTSTLRTAVLEAPETKTALEALHKDSRYGKTAEGLAKKIGAGTMDISEKEAETLVYALLGKMTSGGLTQPAKLLLNDIGQAIQRQGSASLAAGLEGEVDTKTGRLKRGYIHPDILAENIREQATAFRNRLIEELKPFAKNADAVKQLDELLRDPRQGHSLENIATKLRDNFDVPEAVMRRLEDLKTAVVVNPVTGELIELKEETFDRLLKEVREWVGPRLSNDKVEPFVNKMQEQIARIKGLRESGENAGRIQNDINTFVEETSAAFSNPIEAIFRNALTRNETAAACFKVERELARAKNVKIPRKGGLMFTWEDINIRRSWDEYFKGEWRAALPKFRDRPFLPTMALLGVTLAGGIYGGYRLGDWLYGPAIVERGTRTPQDAPVIGGGYAHPRFTKAAPEVKTWFQAQVVPGREAEAIQQTLRDRIRLDELSKNTEKQAEYRKAGLLRQLQWDQEGAYKNSSPAGQGWFMQNVSTGKEAAAVHYLVEQRKTVDALMNDEALQVTFRTHQLLKPKPPEPKVTPVQPAPARRKGTAAPKPKPEEEITP